MSTRKTNPKTIDLESISNLSTDKRALLARRLTKAKQGSTDRKQENIRHTNPVLGNRFVERFRALMRQQGSDTPEAEILAWFESADDEMAALQRKAEKGEISENERGGGKTSIFIAGKILSEQHFQSTAIQQRYRRFLIDHNLVPRVMEHPKYKFTANLFDNNVQHWEENFSFLKGIPNLRFLEIGSFEGRSTCWLLEHILTHETSTIICIDPFNEIDQPLQEEYFDFNIRQTGVAYKVTKLRGHSQIALRFLSAASFDFIYIDGSHTAGDILQDSILSWDLLRHRGILVFDDYEHIRPLSVFDPTILQPKQAVDAFLSLVAGRYLMIHKGWQVALTKLY